MNIKDFISRQHWIWAKTYAKKAPHEYIVRDNINGTDEEFMEFARFIEDKGITMHFYNMSNHYIFVGEYYYWVMKDNDNDPTMIINRARTIDYKISVAWKGVI